MINRRLFFISGILFITAFIFGIFAVRDYGTASVIIEWTTASEIDTVGFNLYRSEQPEGEFERVNSGLIPASDDPLTGGDYKYIDGEVQPGNTYYYLLEDIETNGRTTRHGPIETKAESAGSVEGLISVVLGVSGIICFLIWMRKRVNAND